MRVPSPLQKPLTGECLINDLPDELLAYIFEIGQRDEEDASDEEWETDDEGEGEDGVAMIKQAKAADGEMEMVDEDKIMASPAPVLPFEVKVTHVCKKWRESALASPTLWMQINLRPPFTQAEAYLARSVGAALEVKLDTEEIGGFFDPEDDEDFMTLENFTRALDLVIPHVHRWKSFEISAHDYAYIHPAIRRLSELPAAPMLEQLRLYHHDEIPDSITTFVPAELRDLRLALFSGNTPKLAELALWGVHVDWTRTAGQLHNLVDLELAYHTFDVRPSFKDFSRMLKNSPGLRTMSLCSSGPAGASQAEWLESFDAEDIHAAAQEGDGTTSVTSLTLPELHHLNLAYHSPEYATALIEALTLPRLADLTIDYEGDDFTILANALVQAGFLTTINAFRMRSLPCDANSIVAMLHCMKTNLRLISFSFTFCDAVWFKLLTNIPGAERISTCEDDDFPMPSPPESEWTVAATRPLAIGDSSTAVQPAPFLPKLENLYLSGLTGTQVKFFVQRRKDMGVPLKELWLDEDSELLPEEEEWLRANVDKFDYFELSDMDTDDDDDEEMFAEMLADGDGEELFFSDDEELEEDDDDWMDDE